jgi:hypothetical protein
MVPDQGMRDYIVNGIFEPFNNISNFGRLFHNVINLAFMYAFSCYNDMANRNYCEDGGMGILDRCKKEGNANSVRVIRTMEKVYNEYPITNELIQFVLLDIYFDFEMGRKSRLKEYIPDCFNPAEAQLNDYFPIISQSIGRSRADLIKKLGREKVHRMFEDLLRLFPFISRASLVFDEERQWYVFRIEPQKNYPDGIVNTFGAITRICEQEPLYYCLSDIQNATLKYEKIGTKDYILSNLSEKEDNGYSGGVLRAPFGLPIDEEYVCSYLFPSKLEKKIQYTAACAIEQLFNINYKYIKNLALAIADALGQQGYGDCRKALSRAFAKEYPDAFERFDPELKNWDAVVLMLLIEAGPSEVLQNLFYYGQDINEDIATEIIGNLIRRSNTRDVDKLNALKDGGYLHNRAVDSVKIRQLMLNASPIKTKTYEHIYRSLVAEAMANLLLASLTDKKEGKADVSLDSDLFYIGNTQQNIEALEDLKHCTNAQRQCEGVKIVFGDLIKKIICFYEGVFSYGAVKLQYEKKNETVTEAEAVRYQKEAENAFVTAAKGTYQKLVAKQDNSILAILRDFLNLAEKCFETKGNSYESKDSTHHLYTALGKDSIFDPREFRKHVDVDRLEDMNESNVGWWIEKAIEVIRFLQTGSFEHAAGDNRPYTAITPFIASYNKQNDTRDGYHTAMFTLIIDSTTEEEQKQLCEVHVLSEFRYNMSSKYYCLPNIGRATKKWWIDPFIIKCQVFDDIFETR